MSPSSKKAMSYKQAGVNISVADEAKEQMARDLETNDARILNKVGAFASLIDGSFPDYKHPVLAMKTEEPGTKQILAFQHGHIDSICKDMVHHLINDIVVMGANPLCVQDAIICGKLEKDVVTSVVRGIADACKAQGCTLTGGETSEQPGMLEAGRYILTSSVIGIVEKSKIIDGSAIREGDVILSLPSSGVHTNGYSLIRRLMAESPAILEENVDGKSFLDTILIPHRCYHQPLRGVLQHAGLHGLAHITGSGIEGNLSRILPPSLTAVIDLASIPVLPIFSVIRRYANASDADMLQTYNLGVGMIAVVAKEKAEEIQKHLSAQNCEATIIGMMKTGDGSVRFENSLQWK